MSQVPNEDMDLKRPTVRIVSDGTVHNTKVYLPLSDGSLVEVPYVTEIKWSVAVGHPPCATISLHRVAVDVIGQTKKPSSDD